MQCPTCYGHRLFYYQGVYLPCPDCEGFGSLHCCDGLQAQPEYARERRWPLATADDWDTDALTTSAAR